MGILRNFLRKFVRSGKTKVLSDGKDNNRRSKSEKFKKDVQGMSSKSDSLMLNGKNLHSEIIKGLGADERIVEHIKVNGTLLDFFEQIMIQNGLSRRFLDKENIDKIKNAIQGCMGIERETLRPRNTIGNVLYGIEIDPETRGIQLKICNPDGTGDKYSYRINKEGNLIVRRDKYIDEEIVETVYGEYDDKGMERKRDARRYRKYKDGKK